MKVYDLYSKRKKRELGQMPDVFVYDELPRSLRVQIIHIWEDAIPEDGYLSYEIHYYKMIHDILCREYGLFYLISEIFVSQNGYQSALKTFFLDCETFSPLLDIIELTFKIIENEVANDIKVAVGKNNGPYKKRIINIYPINAIKELNHRFLEHGIGYAFESGQIIRKDSEIIHQEAVKPVLNFLSSPEYKGANEEFLIAHEHYRHKKYKESLNECLKSFESVMKTICDKRGWVYKPTDTAKTLIEICFQNGLIPSYLQTQFTALKSVLESGIPTARNKTSGHGQGVTPTAIPDYFAHYVMNLTATTILLLVEAEKQLP